MCTTLHEWHCYPLLPTVASKYNNPSAEHLHNKPSAITDVVTITSLILKLKKRGLEHAYVLFIITHVCLKYHLKYYQPNILLMSSVMISVSFSVDCTLSLLDIVYSTKHKLSMHKPSMCESAGQWGTNGKMLQHALALVRLNMPFPLHVQPIQVLQYVPFSLSHKNLKQYKKAMNMFHH